MLTTAHHTARDTAHCMSKAESSKKKKNEKQPKNADFLAIPAFLRVKMKLILGISHKKCLKNIFSSQFEAGLFRFLRICFDLHSIKVKLWLYKVDAIWCLHLEVGHSWQSFFLLSSFSVKYYMLQPKSHMIFLFSKHLQTLRLIALPWALPNDEGEGAS